MLCTVAATTLAIALSAPSGWFTSPAPAHPSAAQHHHHHASAHDAPIPNPYPVPPPVAHTHGPGCKACQPGGKIVAPGPGYGWGFPNGNPDGYGWVDYGDALPLGGDRITDYFFRRHNAILPQQMFFPTYYNPYIQRGQRYVPYVGCGGDHPFGQLPSGSALTQPLARPDRPVGTPPTSVPVFDGQVESTPAAASATPASRR